MSESNMSHHPPPPQHVSASSSSGHLEQCVGGGLTADHVSLPSLLRSQTHADRVSEDAQLGCFFVVVVVFSLLIKVNDPANNEILPQSHACQSEWGEHTTRKEL